MYVPAKLMTLRELLLCELFLLLIPMAAYPTRHTLPQLLIGSAVSLLACGISLLTYGLG